jgi:hypothetical protein
VTALDKILLVLGTTNVIWSIGLTVFAKLMTGASLRRLASELAQAFVEMARELRRNAQSSGPS